MSTFLFNLSAIIMFVAMAATAIWIVTKMAAFFQGLSRDNPYKVAILIAAAVVLFISALVTTVDSLIPVAEVRTK